MLRHTLFAILLAGSAAAEGLSPEALKGQVDAALGVRGQYLDILSDPNPVRGREAMKLMLGSGEAELVRLALDHGLKSGDPVMQRIALEGFFDSGPALHVTLDGSGLEDVRGFQNDLKHLNGSMDGQKTGFATLQLGDRAADGTCWTWTDGKTCAVVLNDAGAAIFFRGYWYPMALDEAGVLRGVSNMYYTKAPVPFAIPVAP